MNAIRGLALLLVLMSTMANASEKKLKISCETVSCAEVQYNPKYDKLREVENCRHHHTFVRLEENPCNDQELEVVIKRPLLPNDANTSVEKPSLEHLEYCGSLINGEEPCFILLGVGYLPGEKIEISFKSNSTESDPVNINPNPLTIQSKKDSATISFELVSLEPTIYNENYYNFDTNEKVKFGSLSNGELMSSDFKINKSGAAMYMPAVKGRKGGNSKVLYTRENGDKFAFNIPWGEEFLNHVLGKAKPAIYKFAAIKKCS